MKSAHPPPPPFGSCGLLRRLGTLRTNCHSSTCTGIYFHSKIEKATSGLLFMSIGGMLLLHVFQMSFTFGIITRTSWSLPIKLWLNCPVVRQYVESGLSACWLPQTDPVGAGSLAHSTGES